MEDVLFRGNREPTLDQILAEPIVQTLMKRDGVDEFFVRRLMQQARAAIQPPHQWIVLGTDDDDPEDPPPRHPGVIARAVAARTVTTPAWPRVFPSL